MIKSLFIHRRIALYLFLLFLISWNRMSAQLSPFCDQNNLTNMGAITPTTSAVTSTASGANVQSKRLYWSFSATAGKTYHFDLCSSTTANDPFLRIYSGSSVSTCTYVTGDNDYHDYCSAKPGIEWLCTSSGSYLLLATNNVGAVPNTTATCGTFASNSQPIVLTYSINSNSAYSLPFSENFTSVTPDKGGKWVTNTAQTAKPSGNTESSYSAWRSVPSGDYSGCGNCAGGSAPEMIMEGNQACSGCVETMTMSLATPLNTQNVNVLNFLFKHTLYVTNQGTSGSNSGTLAFQASPDGSTWQNVWTQNYTVSGSGLTTLISPTTVTTPTYNPGNSNTTYIRFTITGVMFKVWGWLIDDIGVSNPCPSPLQITASSATACAGTNIILTAPTNTYSSYSWSGPGVVASSANSATVNVTGTYTVNAGTCGSATKSITIISPTITTVPSSQTVCAGSSVSAKNFTLSPSGTSVNWTNSNASIGLASSGTGNISSFAAPTPSVQQTGIITATPSYSGCTGSSKTFTITVNPLPNTSAGSNQTITCTNTVAVLSGTSTTSGVTYSWMPGGTTPTNYSTSVTSAGTYTLKVTNTASGCTNTSTVSVTSNTLVPNASAGTNQTITCTNTVAVLSGTSTTSGTTYSWTPGGATPVSYSTSVTTAGTYTLKVTHTTSGCTNTSTVSVISNTLVPNASAGTNQTITCTNTVAVLSGTSTTSGTTYSWTPGGTTPVSYSTSVTTAGTYTLKVTHTASGCTNTSTVSVVKPLSSSATITDYENDTIKGQVNLCIMGGTPPYNVVWNGLKIPSSTEVYHSVIDSSTGISVDSIQFKHQIDSLRESTINSNLLPGNYLVTIYDSVNDSILLNINIGAKSTNQFFANGISYSACSIADKIINNIQYVYGTGQCITQQGVFNTGQHMAVNYSEFDFSKNSELSFYVPNNNDIISVGFQEKKAEINGSTTDIEQNTSFRFNGNGTFDIMYQSGSIFHDNFSSGDKFTFKINSTPGKISYYKNEVSLIEANVLPLNYEMGYLPKIAFGNTGALVSGLKIFSPTLIGVTLGPVKLSGVTGSVTDVNCSNLCGGSINASGHNLFFPYPQKYELTGGNLSAPVVINVSPLPFLQQNNVTFNNLCPGTYTITYYSLQQFFYALPFPPDPGYVPPTPVAGTASQTFEVGYVIDWENVKNCNIISPDNSLQKNINTNLQDAGASSSNVILASNTLNQWLEWKASPNIATEYNAVGFSVADPDCLLQSIGYSFRYLQSSRIFLVFKNNLIQSLTTGGVIGHYTVNDKFRIEKNGNMFIFKLNNTIIHTFNAIASADYFVDASILRPNGLVNKPRSSFGCRINEQYAMLEKTLDGGYYNLKHNKLFFAYNEEYVSNTLNYNIYNGANNIVASNTLGSGIISSPNSISGDNRFTLDFSSSSFASGYYVLEIINAKKDKKYLRFKK